MAKSEDRFIRTYSQGNSFGMLMQIWVDKQTGVNYLFQSFGGTGCGLTPLLDPQGKPIITPVQRSWEA